MNDHQRYVTVHGHFYQPPRENPWLEIVEVQDSAAPHHDWNDRITSECYATNGASRIVDKHNQIIRIVNNYSRISFNFGATLLSWLEHFAPRVYRMIQEADDASVKRYGGHGSAMAQVYNHIIMPLASTRDRITQVEWGIADFQHRFGRKPEGMWLAETAVDLETLDILAQHGILFTVLAPSQCARVRPLAADGSFEPVDFWWTEAANASVNPTHPYKVALKDGRSIAVFFYDGPTSRAVAFERLLDSGDKFADRLMHGFRHDDPQPQLVHIATDGESYGHHHRQGEMALSYALLRMEQEGRAKITNYGEFLDKFPPQFEAQVADNTSWSCFHGIERWRSDCGCSGGKHGWNQRWRRPLREALDKLRDDLLPLTTSLAENLFGDFDQARNSYIGVILHRTRGSVDDFLRKNATHRLKPAERTAALKLMELERHALLMYTSCGWFFDDISGIETVQIIAYAARVLQLAEELFGEAGVALEQDFIAKLQQAVSNEPSAGTGADVYRKYIKRSKVGLEEVGAHYAISSMFQRYPDRARVFSYDTLRKAYEVLHFGRGRIVVGRADISSTTTEECEPICFAVLHLGDQNLSAAVKREQPGDDARFHGLVEELRRALAHANVPEVVRLIDQYFGQTAYSLASLFRDEQRRILQLILDRTVSEMETELRKIYEDHSSLLRFLSVSGIPSPPALGLVSGFAVNSGLRQALTAEQVDASQVRELTHLAEADHVKLDSTLLNYLAGQAMKRTMVALQRARNKREPLNAALDLASVFRQAPFDVNLWSAQNIWHDIMVARFGMDDNDDPEIGEMLYDLGRRLNINVERLVVEAEARPNGAPGFLEYAGAHP